MKKNLYSKMNKCIGCGKTITDYAIRCKSCSQEGVLNHGYGKPGFWAGKKMSKKHKENISSSKSGNKNPMYGKGGILSPTYGRVGSKNPAWLGGTSRHPYPFEFDENLKLYIKSLDGCICQECGDIKYLCVHHIDYDKNNLSENNLITLCRSCNIRANMDRILWQKHFESIVNWRIRC